MAIIQIPLDVSYGLLSLFTTILHNIFLLYHVDMFVSVYKIDKVSFWIGETVFLIWNSFNDPLFGWLSDYQYLSQSPTASATTPQNSSSWTRNKCQEWCAAETSQNPRLQAKMNYDPEKGESYWTYTKENNYGNGIHDPGGDSLPFLKNQQSHLGHSTESSSLNSVIVSKRLDNLSWNGPLLAMSFLLFWVRWFPTGLQFVICLCVYDSFLTMVDLQHSALLADLAISAEIRTRLNARSSLFSALGSLSVFVSYSIWDRNNLDSFRAFCVLLCIISITGFYFGTNLLRKAALPPKYINNLQQDDFSKRISYKFSAPKNSPGTSALKKYIKQLTSHRNFCWFAVMNLVQVFHCHFNSNFFPLFLEVLLGTHGTSLGAFLLGTSFVIPHINNVYFLSLCRKHGVYRIILLLFLFKFLLSILMLCVGPGCVWAVCVYVASNRVFTEGTCKLLALVISDLVDEDCVLHGRSQPVSALIFGTASLLSKPGQTLAPLLGLWIWSWQTGYDMFSPTIGEHPSSFPLSNASSDSSLRLACFNILIYVPLACAIIQMSIWLLKFRLHGHRLQWVKAVRSGATLSGTI